MADQLKLKPLAASTFYPNTAASRQLVPHTIARDADITQDSGLKTQDSPDLPSGLNIIGRWQSALPNDTPFPFEITPADLAQGQKNFQIYCTPCHSDLGDGNGMIPQRGFTRPPTFHSARLRNAPPAYFYNVITNGLGAMFPYNDRITPDDRWRITAYIRALQLSQHANLAQLSDSDKQKLGEATK